MTTKQKKEAKNMTYDKSVLEALKEHAEKEDRSESYIANKILKEALTPTTRKQLS